VRRPVHKTLGMLLSSSLEQPTAAGEGKFQRECHPLQRCPPGRTGGGSLVQEPTCVFDSKLLLAKSSSFIISNTRATTQLQQSNSQPNHCTQTLRHLSTLTTLTHSSSGSGRSHTHPVTPGARSLTVAQRLHPLHRHPTLFRSQHTSFIPSPSFSSWHNHPLSKVNHFRLHSEHSVGVPTSC